MILYLALARHTCFHSFLHLKLLVASLKNLFRNIFRVFVRFLRLYILGLSYKICVYDVAVNKQEMAFLYINKIIKFINIHTKIDNRL